MDDGPFVSLSLIGGGTFTDGLKLWPNSEVDEEFLLGGGLGVRGETLRGGRGGGGSSFTRGEIESLNEPSRVLRGGRGGGVGLDARLMCEKNGWECTLNES